MKRLGKQVQPKFTDKEVTDFIYERTKELLTDTEFVNYLKGVIKRSGRSLQEILDNEYDAEVVLQSTMRQSQDIYDSCYDRFFSSIEDPLNINNDPTNPNSDTFVNVSNYIFHFDNYNDKSLADLILKNKKLIKELKL